MTFITSSDIDLDRYKIKNLTSNSKILLDSKNLAYVSIKEKQILDLLILVDNYKKPESNEKFQNVVLRTHPGGKQTSVVYETKLGTITIAIKIYKFILNHLLIHTIASNYLSNSGEINELAKNLGLKGKIIFPKTLAIKVSEKEENSAILIQEWIYNGEDIYKRLPNSHVHIIREITKFVTQKFMFMLDIMTKNWQICDQHNVYYSDLVLFSPKGDLLKNIREISEKLM